MARSRHALTLAAIFVIAAGDRAAAQAVPPAPPTPPDPSAVLLPPVVPGPVGDRTPAEPPPTSASALPSADVTLRPAARIVFDPAESTSVRSSDFEDSRRAAADGPRRGDDADDGLAYLTDGLYRRGTDGLATRRSRRDDSSRTDGPLVGWWKRTFGKDEEGRGPGERLGDSMNDLLSGGRRVENDTPRQWYESDRAFCDFVSPLSNPFYFEDPRSLTELRGVGFYQTIPNSDGFFRGGNAFFLGGQARLTFTERFSLVVHKLGFAQFNPGGGSIYRGGGGLSEFWVGPKYVIYRDPEFKSLITLGTQFQLSFGSSAALQDTGSLSIVPYASAAQKLLSTQIGTFNGMASAGYSFSTTRDRSDFFYASAHLDFDIANGHRFYPLAELNWFSYTTDGRARPISTEGRDFANVGAAAKGNNLVTWALGLRWRSLNGRWEVGGGYEGFLFGQRGLFDGRIMLDVIWRF